MHVHIWRVICLAILAAVLAAGCPGEIDDAEGDVPYDELVDGGGAPGSSSSSTGSTDSTQSKTSAEPKGKPSKPDGGKPTGKPGDASTKKPPPGAKSDAGAAAGG